LTAAQSFFALAVLSNLTLSLREAGLLFGLFWLQFLLGGLVPEDLHGVERVAVGLVYLALGIFFVVRDRLRWPPLISDGLFAPHEKLAETKTAIPEATAEP
jgi:hypothetical protein